MALQQNLTISGIGAEPGRFSQIDTGWTSTSDDGVVVWRPNASGIMIDTGAELASADVSYYSMVHLTQLRQNL